MAVRSMARGMPTFWVWAVLTTGLVWSAAVTEVQRQIQRDLAHYTGLLSLVHESRLDLARGFLHTSLATSGRLPYDRGHGLALLGTAVSSLQRSVESQRAFAVGGDGAVAEQVQAFAKAAAAFADLVATPPENPARRSAHDAAMSAALLDLEVQAEEVVHEIQRQAVVVFARHGVTDAVAFWAAVTLFVVLGLTVSAGARSRARAGAALRTSEARYHLVMENSLDALLLTSPDGSILAANPAACEMFGRTEEELCRVGRAGVVDLDDPRLPGLLAERACTGRAHGQLTAVRKDGTRFQVDVSAAIFTDQDGQTRSSLVLRDVTARVLAEAGARRMVDDLEASRRELDRLNAELERRVLDRTAELEAANHELDAFADAVSHDLRAPLRAMTGFSVAVLEDHGHLLPDEAKGYLIHIRQASSDMEQLIDALLVLSRVTCGEIVRRRADLSALAVRVCEELSRGDPARRVRWDVQPGLVARGDGRMIEVILRNLLDNAWKYTACRADPTVRVYAESVDGRTWHCVADNGAGFDMRHADRLFQPFQRLHRQEEFPGIGIGLATVQRVIRRHGGGIGATATLGGGATFRFWLPDDDVPA